MRKRSEEQLQKWAGEGRRRTNLLLRWAGGLIATGLILQIVTLFWSHPLAFLAFIAVGVGPLAIGMLIFLWVLLQTPAAPASDV